MQVDVWIVSTSVLTTLRLGVLRSTKVAMTGFESTSHTTVGRAGYPLNYPGGVQKLKPKPAGVRSRQALKEAE